MVISKRLFKEPITYIAGILLFLSAFSKFDAQWLTEPVAYPPLISWAIESNRIFIGIILLIGMIAIFLRKKIITFPTAYIFIFLFHAFLSVKSILYGGDAWIAGLLGILIVMASSMIFSNSLIGTERDIYLIFYVCLYWIIIGTALIASDGYDHYATNSRIFLFTSHPNHAGSIFAISAFVMLFMLTNSIAKSKILLITLGLISTYYLISTGSRGAMLSLIFGCSVTLYLSRSKYSVLVIAIAALGASLMALMDNELISSFLSSQVDRGNTRSGTYGAALNDFLQSPFIGAPIEGARYIYVENTILASMQLGGAIGLFLIIGFYTVGFNYFTRIVLHKKYDLDKFSIFYAGLFTITFFQSMFEAFPLNFIGGGTFLMIISIIGMKKSAHRNFTNKIIRYKND